VVDFVAYLYHTFPDRTIGVISFYMAQVQLLRSLIAKRLQEMQVAKASEIPRCYYHGAPGSAKVPRGGRDLPAVLGNNRIKVHTVDSFQGSEMDFIVLSFVRAHGPHNNIGFVKDARRLNVAATRAKYGLLMLGSQKTLTARSSGSVKTFVEQLQQAGMVHHVNDLMASIHKRTPPATSPSRHVAPRPAPNFGSSPLSSTFLASTSHRPRTTDIPRQKFAAIPLPPPPPLEPAFTLSVMSPPARSRPPPPPPPHYTPAAIPKIEYELQSVQQDTQMQSNCQHQREPSRRERKRERDRERSRSGGSDRSRDRDPPPPPPPSSQQYRPRGFPNPHLDSSPRHIQYQPPPPPPPLNPTGRVNAMVPYNDSTGRRPLRDQQTQPKRRKK
jgi:hypothetical protein